MKVFGIWLLGIITLALFAVFIYPTPFVYMVNGAMVFRTNRITGKAEVSSSEGWKPYLTPTMPMQQAAQAKKRQP